MYSFNEWVSKLHLYENPIPVAPQAPAAPQAPQTAQVPQTPAPPSPQGAANGPEDENDPQMTPEDLKAAQGVKTQLDKLLKQLGSHRLNRQTKVQMLTIVMTNLGLKKNDIMTAMRMWQQ